MVPTDIHDRLRERLAAEGLTPSAHREAIDEIAEHLTDLHRAAERDGNSADEADAIVEAELARMGSLADAVRERARKKTHPAEALSGWKAGLVTDVRHAVRALRLNRSYSAIVILTLATGIGACTAVFSVINALLLGSLPYPNPQQLAIVMETDAADRAQSFIVSYPNYEDWKREAKSFSAMGIWEYLTFNVASAAEPEQVQGIRASASLFAVLGVPPALGRVFNDAEEAPGHRVVVISDRLWRTHFGGSPSAIGSSLRLNGEAHQVIGVMPRGFQFPWRNNGVWVPIAVTEQDRERGSHSFWVAARMRSDVPFESARAEIQQIGRALQRYEENRNEGTTITLMAEQGLGRLRTTLTPVMWAVSLVLVIACVNIANLQLGRALTRRREFVLRLSLGAGVGRLARQLFAESAVLAAAGGLGGVAVAWAAARAGDLILTPGFTSLPYRGEVPIVIDVRVLSFAAAASLLSAALFGWAPLVGLRRRDPAVLLRDGERGSTGAALMARRGLVAIEVALAIVVLSGAGLLVKSLAGLMAVNPGLDPREVLTLQVSLPQADTYGPAVRRTFCADLSASADGVPGIRSIGAVSHLPLGGSSAGRALTIEGMVPASPQDAAAATYRMSCPGYFATLGVPIISGRDFSHRDVTTGEKVTIVNRKMAERYWPGQSPLGKRLKMGAATNNNPWMVVVGVIDNIRHFGLDSDVRPEFYAPYPQYAWPTMTITAKTVGEPMLWQSTLREIVKRLDADLPVAQMKSMETVVGSSVYWRETPMRLLTGFAVIGLALASIGVYGVLAYYVSQRTREIGVRAALGATRRQLAGMVIRQSLLPIITGVVFGVAGSLATGRLLQDFLFQVKPGDPQVIAVIVFVLAGVGLLASWLPARRAAAIDPLVALRDE